eukprot:4436942-Pleurochrysis_carterae.AAC.1
MASRHFSHELSGKQHQKRVYGLLQNDPHIYTHLCAYPILCAPVRWESLPGLPSAFALLRTRQHMLTVM